MADEKATFSKYLEHNIIIGYTIEQNEIERQGGQRKQTYLEKMILMRIGSSSLDSIGKVTFFKKRSKRKKIVNS